MRIEEILAENSSVGEASKVLNDYYKTASAGVFVMIELSFLIMLHYFLNNYMFKQPVTLYANGSAFILFEMYT